MVSGNELAIHMGMPRKSVCGLPVIEHADFGKEVVRYGTASENGGINLGKVFNMGSAAPNGVFLDKGSLTMHTFVTGSTGSGKSNTIYEMIRQANNMGANFMIIEPAKGEYKHVFGNRPDVNVFGTNPEYSDLLRINPFRFPNGVHVLEHVDRLVEIFNVCWPKGYIYIAISYNNRFIRILPFPYLIVIGWSNNSSTLFPLIYLYIRYISLIRRCNISFIKICYNLFNIIHI